MDANYIIVQAGGKGSRMGTLTRNKPKALVPVDNLPMLFHLFRKYPNKKFIVIGDYKYDVLEKYLCEFADVDYEIICATGKNGTCAGIREAMTYIPAGKRFTLIWCDLVLPKDYVMGGGKDNLVGISKDFPCRWKFANGRFLEERSVDQGVAGFFVFKDKNVLKNVPDEGEFVRWLKDQNIKFVEEPLYHTHEYGLFSEWEKLPKTRCRPFNRMEIDEGQIYKVPVDEQGRDLAKREVAWYKQVADKHFENIPEIYSYEPLCMELIKGKNIYEYTSIADEQKEKILEQIIGCLKAVHELGSVPANRDSYYDAYIGKTIDRLRKVRNLVPFANNEYVVVNGRKCRNVFYYWEELEKLVMEYMPNKFVFIHGDCTFSNMMLREDMTPVLIDPRGYFGKTEIYGDIAYDWVKLYYSLFSNYDQFNLKRFDLRINENDVCLTIASNNWESMEGKFFELVGGDVDKKQMMLLLAITWLSLTTYAWEDYDSICGAFYNGLYYLEEALS